MTTTRIYLGKPPRPIRLKAFVRGVALGILGFGFLYWAVITLAIYAGGSE